MNKINPAMTFAELEDEIRKQKELRDFQTSRGMMDTANAVEMPKQRMMRIPWTRKPKEEPTITRLEARIKELEGANKAFGEQYHTYRETVVHLRGDVIPTLRQENGRLTELLVESERRRKKLEETLDRYERMFGYEFRLFSKYENVQPENASLPEQLERLEAENASLKNWGGTSGEDITDPRFDAETRVSDLEAENTRLRDVQDRFTKIAVADDIEKTSLRERLEKAETMLSFLDADHLKEYEADRRLAGRVRELMNNKNLFVFCGLPNCSDLHRVESESDLFAPEDGKGAVE